MWRMWRMVAWRQMHIPLYSHPPPLKQVPGGRDWHVLRFEWRSRGIGHCFEATLSFPWESTRFVCIGCHTNLGFLGAASTQERPTNIIPKEMCNTPTIRSTLTVLWLLQNSLNTKLLPLICLWECFQGAACFHLLFSCCMCRFLIG